MLALSEVLWITGAVSLWCCQRTPDSSQTPTTPAERKEASQTPTTPVERKEAVVSWQSLNQIELVKQVVRSIRARMRSCQTRRGATSEVDLSIFLRGGAFKGHPEVFLVPFINGWRHRDHTW